MLNVDRKNDEVMYTVCICFAIAMLNYLKLRAKKKTREPVRKHYVVVVVVVAILHFSLCFVTNTCCGCL